MEDITHMTTPFYALHCYGFNLASLLHYCRAHFPHIPWQVHFNTMLFMSDKSQCFHRIQTQSEPLHQDPFSIPDNNRECFSTKIYHSLMSIKVN